MENQTTDFGYQKVTAKEKTHLVASVFDSVASNYDLMNDLMSLGQHRLWKKYIIHCSGIRTGQSVLDVASGTADITKLLRQKVGKNGAVFSIDINQTMLKNGRDKLINAGIVSGVHYVQGDAEALPFSDQSFACITIAFGLRNITNKQKAIQSMLAKLQYGGCLIILEFSKLQLSLLQPLYDLYSFDIIPKIGKFVAKDEPSYRYLIESIRNHPDQETLANMLKQEGFAKVEYQNLMGGIVSMHKSYKF